MTDTPAAASDPATTARQAEAPFEPPPGFTCVTTRPADVLVPETYERWDPGQQRGYLTQRAINAAEGQTVAYAYDCVRRATEHDRQRDPLDTATTMVGASMALSRRGSSRLVTSAVELIERLPRTAALLTTGWIGIREAHAIAEETALVEDSAMPELDRLISEGLAPTRRRTHPPRIGPLRKMLSKHITACDPIGADARARQSRRTLGVKVTPLPDDRALLTATLTAVDALEISNRLDALVRAACPEDPRSIGELRAAGLLALSRGWTCLPEPDGDHPDDPDAQAAARRVVIHTYEYDDPGHCGLFLAGYGPISGFSASELQRSARRRLDAVATLADPDSEAATRYSPSEALINFCRGRDGTCVFPGCQTPAENTDLDHIIPFDHEVPSEGGLTTSDDLASLCRTHHRLKTEGIWAYYRDTSGAYVWIHGKNHPDVNPGTQVSTEPTGPLSGFAEPVHPERSRRQKEAAEEGRTGSGIAEARRRTHRRERHAAERRRLRNQAEQHLREAS